MAEEFPAAPSGAGLHRGHRKAHELRTGAEARGRRRRPGIGVLGPYSAHRDKGRLSLPLVEGV